MYRAVLRIFGARDKTIQEPLNHHNKIYKLTMGITH